MGWDDPWPSAQKPYYDPPWLMWGRAVTAWFEAPWSVVTATLSPALRPEPAKHVRARLRFYDVSFQAIAETDVPLAPRQGRFREGVIAIAANGGGFAGEVSVFLWTDSETYLMWGREAFCWPIIRADVALSGSMWTEQDMEGTTGEARIADQWGFASLRHITISGSTNHGTPGGHWLTPFRVLHAAGCQGETRELLVVRPAVRKVGRNYTATADMEIDFPPGHPLSGLPRSLKTDVEVADGFELLVGADVQTVLPERRNPATVRGT